MLDIPLSLLLLDLNMVFPTRQIMELLAGFFSATGQALASSLIAVSRGIIVISLMAFMLSKLFGVTGVWMAFPVTEVVTFGIAMGIQGVSKRKE